MKFKPQFLRSAGLLTLTLSLVFPSAIVSAKVRAKKSPKPSSSARDAKPQKKVSRGARVKPQTLRDNLVSKKRQRAAELLRLQARRRAEAARLAAIARQRALNDAMRAEVQAMISRDNPAGEDPEVRQVALNALGDHAGTVVVMDPNTGRVYAIVNQEWALRRGFKPCSTIKLVTGLAGLGEHVIDPADTANISDSNKMNLTNALAYSNNTYFQQVGGQVGFENMISYARRLGLGEKTGINAPNETQGQLPNLRSGYAVNHMSSHGDDFKVTALQLATLVSAMANGGKLITPRVVRTPQELARFKPIIRRSINMNLETLRYMVPGMVGAVNYGSGRRAHDPQATVAGKTGTCIENGSWVGLFTSYAPLANPKLAVVVIARGADAHSHFPAAVAGRIYRELNGRFGTPTNLQVATAQPNLKDEKNSLDEEDEDDAGDTEAVADSQPTRATSATRNKLETSMTPVTKPAIVQTHPLVKSSPSNEKVRRVLMPITIKDNKTGDVPRPLTRPRRVTEQ